MSEHSKIEWTDATWNPLRGCTKISPGCKHCYAETFAERFRGVKGHPYEQGFDLRLVPEKLAEPFLWSSPRTVFVNSMSDLFQPGVPDGYIEDVVRVMVEANWHTYQVLTKRSERLRDLLSTRLRFAADERHIWWGVSVEDRRYGLPRIGHLRSGPASIKFLVGLLSGPIYMPLAYNVALVIHQNENVPITQRANQRMVAIVNTITIAYAERFICSTTSDFKCVLPNREIGNASDAVATLRSFKATA